MSKGTPIYPVRLPQGLVELVDLTIRIRNIHTKGRKWIRSDFFRIALAEKIQKMNRSRKRLITSYQ
jgi:hypothetical protein